MNNLNAARQHLMFHHGDTDGWITLAQKDPHTKRFRQYHYKPEELEEHLSEWTGEDVYFSQGSFYKPQRRIDNIRQLRSLYVDLDVYTMGLDPEWVLGKLEYEYFGQSIPEPNMIIFSGRGLVLVWNIIPIPYQVMALWRAVENHFLELLKDLGADPKATDPTRIFRLAGTINSKNKAIVQTEYRHTYRYDIHDLQYDYLPELTPQPQQKKKRGSKSKTINLFNTYSLHLSRARDIGKLVELRHGEMAGYRENACFLYRYFTCCCSSDPKRALEDTLSLNAEFTTPLSEKEVKTATRSAEKAWAAKSNEKADAAAKAAGYPGAGYNLKNTKLIEWLGITPEEQMEMTSIIGTAEKNRRRRIKYQEDKDAAPPTPKQIEMQQKQDRIRQAVEENPEASIREIAQITGISKSTVQRLINQLK